MPKGDRACAYLPPSIQLRAAPVQKSLEAELQTGLAQPIDGGNDGSEQPRHRPQNADVGGLLADTVDGGMLFTGRQQAEIF